MSPVAAIGGYMSIWRQGARLLQAAAVAAAAASVSLIGAALVFFALIVLVVETEIFPAGLGEDFSLVFFNALPIALGAAVLDCFAILRADAQRSNDTFAFGFATLLLILGAIGLWSSFWFSDDRYPSGGSDLVGILGTLVPGIAVIGGNWAFIRFFFWASGLKHL